MIPFDRRILFGGPRLSGGRLSAGGGVRRRARDAFADTYGTNDKIKTRETVRRRRRDVCRAF